MDPGAQGVVGFSTKSASGGSVAAGFNSASISKDFSETWLFEDIEKCVGL